MGRREALSKRVTEEPELRWRPASCQKTFYEFKKVIFGQYMWSKYLHKLIVVEHIP